jgi:D-glycero-D-manno-heptose 1,7-bisphosphate phosphatase
VLRPAIFLDRDGVINEDYGYVYKSKDLKWIKGAKESIKRLKDLGYYIFVVTNQSGIARGYYSENDVILLHEYMNNLLKQHGSSIDKFYYCPHHPKATVKKYKINCNCRKPKSGMIRQAISEWDIDIESSFLIGDSERDIISANNLGIRGYLFEQGDLLEFIDNNIL